MIPHKALLALGPVAMIAAAAHAPAYAQAPVPGVVVQGSSSVQSGDLPAARVGDATTTPDGGVVQGSSNVFIDGKAAARVGDKTNCGVIVRGSSNVFINGKPMARAGDNTSGC
jgi:uncharacterized Zn-binding protein involved in type VI secretion